MFWLTPLQQRQQQRTLNARMEKGQQTPKCNGGGHQSVRSWTRSLYGAALPRTPLVDSSVWSTNFGSIASWRGESLDVPSSKETSYFASSGLILSWLRVWAKLRFAAYSRRLWWLCSSLHIEQKMAIVIWNQRAGFRMLMFVRAFCVLFSHFRLPDGVLFEGRILPSVKILIFSTCKLDDGLCSSLRARDQSCYGVYYGKPLSMLPHKDKASSIKLKDIIF
jgi:hypothetical protein